MLHFLKAPDIDPIAMEDALVRAILKRPSADNVVALDEAGAAVSVKLPWGSVEEAQDRLIHLVHGTVGIHKLLIDDALHTYVENPAKGSFVRIPRLYWLQHPPTENYTLRAPVGDATGWDAAMQGQPILVDAAELDQWGAAADAALAMLAKPQAVDLAEPKARKRTNPPPKWVGWLETRFRRYYETRDQWALDNPGSVPPRERTNKYWTELVAKEFPTLKVYESKVGYHLRKMKQAHGR